MPNIAALQSRLCGGGALQHAARHIDGGLLDALAASSVPTNPAADYTSCWPPNGCGRHVCNRHDRDVCSSSSSSRSSSSREQRRILSDSSYVCCRGWECDDALRFGRNAHFGGKHGDKIKTWDNLWSCPGRGKGGGGVSVKRSSRLRKACSGTVQIILGGADGVRMDECREAEMVVPVRSQKRMNLVCRAQAKRLADRYEQTVFASTSSESTPGSIVQARKNCSGLAMAASSSITADMEMQLSTEEVTKNLGSVDMGVGNTIADERSLPKRRSVLGPQSELQRGDGRDLPSPSQTREETVEAVDSEMSGSLDRQEESSSSGRSGRLKNKGGGLGMELGEDKAEIEGLFPRGHADGSSSTLGEEEKAYMMASAQKELSHAAQKLLQRVLQIRTADKNRLAEVLGIWAKQASAENPKQSKFPQELITQVALHLCRRQWWGHLALLLDWMTCQSRYKPVLLHYNLLIRAYGKLGHLRRVAATFKALQQTCLQPSVVTFSSLMTAFGKRGLHRHAANLFQEMKDQGIRPNIQVYGSLLDAYCKGCEPDRAMQAFREMQTEGIKPNVNAYNIVINAFSKQGRMSEAEALLREMVDGGCEPDVVTFSTLIRGYGRKEQIQEVERLYKLMKASGWIPGTEARNHTRRSCKLDVKLCTMMIDAFGKGGLVDEAEAMLRQMEEEGISPDINAYTCLVESYGRAKMFDEARTVIDEMEERVRRGEGGRVVRLDSRVYTPLVAAYAREGLWDEATALVNEMRQNGPSPCTLVYNALMSAYGKEGMAARAESVMSAMKDEGVQRTIVTYTSLMEAYGESGDAGKVQGVLKSMAENRVKLDRVSYAVLVNAYVRCGEVGEGERAFHKMQSDGFEVQVSTYNVMIGAYANNLRTGDAEVLFRAMIAANKRPDVVTYNLLLRMYIRCGSRAKMENVYREMQACGVKPNHQTYQMVREAYSKAGNYADAERIVLDMMKTGTSLI